MDNAFIQYWDECLNILDNQLSGVIYDVYVKSLIPISFDGTIFSVSCNSSHAKSTISSRHAETIKNSLSKVIGHNIELKLYTEKELQALSEKKPLGDDCSKKEKNEQKKSGINSRYTFENFVRGKSNDFAYSAAEAIAKSPDNSPFNPLFLYGGVGLGKTHLMYAIANEIIDNNPDKKVLYFSSETFTNELIQSIREGKNQQFRDKYREIDALLIDDIQFLSDKEGTQEEFFHTFNALYNENKIIVISSDRPPKEIQILEERLRSRFSMGLTIDVKLPDFETRTAILSKKAETENIPISEDVTKYIAKNINSNIRDLEGALTRVHAYATLQNSEITIDIAETALIDLINESKANEITIPYIQEIVANYFSLTKEQILGKTRSKNIALPRQIAMYLSREMVDASLPTIGGEFNRDHTTIIHGHEKIRKELEVNESLRMQIIDLKKNIKGE